MWISKIVWALQIHPHSQHSYQYHFSKHKICVVFQELPNCTLCDWFPFPFLTKWSTIHYNPVIIHSICWWESFLIVSELFLSAIFFLFPALRFHFLFRCFLRQEKKYIHHLQILIKFRLFFYLILAYDLKVIFLVEKREITFYKFHFLVSRN